MVAADRGAAVVNEPASRNKSAEKNPRKKMMLTSNNAIAIPNPTNGHYTRLHFRGPGACTIGARTTPDLAKALEQSRGVLRAAPNLLGLASDCRLVGSPFGVVVLLGGLRAHQQASRRVENERDVSPLVEVKHRQQRTCDPVEGMVTDAAQQPVVLDEAEDRGLVGERVVDVVLLGKRGDHEQRQARTVATAPLVCPQPGREAAADGRLVHRLRPVHD